MTVFNYNITVQRPARWAGEVSQYFDDCGTVEANSWEEAEAKIRKDVKDHDCHVYQLVVSPLHR